MKRLVNYIRNLFGTYGEHRTNKFRKQFEAAYPIAAEFLSAIEKYDMEDAPAEPPAFFFKGSFLAQYAVSGKEVAPRSTKQADNQNGPIAEIYSGSL